MQVFSGWRLCSVAFSILLPGSCCSPGGRSLPSSLVTAISSSSHPDTSEPAPLHPARSCRDPLPKPVPLTMSPLAQLHRFTCFITAQVRVLFSLSQPAALCPHCLSLRIKQSITCFLVFKQAVLSFLMCFQLGFAMRLTVYCSSEAAGLLCSCSAVLPRPVFPRPLPVRCL